MSKKKPNTQATNPPPKPSEPIQSVDLGETTPTNTQVVNPKPNPSQQIQTVTKTEKPKNEK